VKLKVVAVYLQNIRDHFSRDNNNIYLLKALA